MCGKSASNGCDKALVMIIMISIMMDKRGKGNLSCHCRIWRFKVQKVHNDVEEVKKYHGIVTKVF